MNSKLSLMITILTAMTINMNLANAALNGKGKGKTNDINMESEQPDLQRGKIRSEAKQSDVKVTYDKVETDLVELIKRDILEKAKINATIENGKRLAKSAYDSLISNQKQPSEKGFADLTNQEGQEGGLFLIGAKEYANSATDGVAFTALLNRVAELKNEGLDVETAYRNAKAEILESVAVGKELPFETFEELMKAIKNCARGILGLKAK